MDHDGCTFYDTGTRRCALHQALGHAALPLACRQFPRVSVSDPRGVSVTLSHYCPTAALSLAGETAVTIVVNPAAFPAGGEYVGLDATTVLPPLLAPGILMDWDAWWECERLAVELIGNGAGSADAVLSRLSAVISEIQTWTPRASEPLIARVRLAFGSPLTGGSLPDRLQLLNEAHTAIPPELRPDVPPRAPRPSDRIVKRFLAAHTFANWAVHGSGGINAWLRSIATAHALIDSGFGVRNADLWLRHLAA